MPRHLNDSKDFWQMVDLPIGHLEDCWLWLGYVHEEGYGYYNWKGRWLKAHRIAYELTFGPIPKGQCVLHRCDIRHCCSPRHLRLGTRGQNNADRHAKGRDACGDNNGARLYHGSKMGHPGESNGWARLSNSMVELMFELRYTKHWTFQQIADEFGVNVTTAHRAITGRSWKHLKH